MGGRSSAHGCTTNTCPCTHMLELSFRHLQVWNALSSSGWLLPRAPWVCYGISMSNPATSCCPPEPWSALVDKTLACRVPDEWIHLPVVSGCVGARACAPVYLICVIQGICMQLFHFRHSHVLCAAACSGAGVRTMKAGRPAWKKCVGRARVMFPEAECCRIIAAGGLRPRMILRAFPRHGLGRTVLSRPA